ncbi:MAG: CerR family C-terminal domain-containing protein [Gemmataceae bacterium]|nr:CerR family C-terminal domain-containing protein [Gemmataceae bacterium]
MARVMAIPSPPPDPRLRLLEAAQAEFSDKGYDGATTRDITRRAGVNIAAINYYFGDKEQLYIEAVKHAHVCATAGGPFPDPLPGVTAADRLAAFIREMVRRMHAPASPTAMKLMMRELAEPGKAADVVVREFVQPMAFALRDILAELLPDIGHKRLLMTGFSVIGQCLFYRQNLPVAELIFGKPAVEELDLAAVADHVVRFTFAALGLAPPYLATGPEGVS